MGKAQREKGKRWEQEVARRLRQIFGDLAVRRSRQAEGALESDVVCPGWWVECGMGKRMNAQQKLAQAVQDCAAMGTRKTPVAVVKVDRQQPVVCMLFEDWLNMVRRFEKYKDILNDWEFDDRPETSGTTTDEDQASSGEP